MRLTELPEPLPKARPVKAQNIILGIDPQQVYFRVPRARSVLNSFVLSTTSRKSFTPPEANLLFQDNMVSIATNRAVGTLV